MARSGRGAIGWIRAPRWPFARVHGSERPIGVAPTRDPPHPPRGQTGLTERAYRRLGRWYLDAILAGLVLFLDLIVIPGYTAIFLVPIFDLAIASYLEYLLVWEVVLGLLAGPGVLVITRRSLAATYAWMGGRRDLAPGEVWRTTVEGAPRAIAAVCAWYAAWSTLPVAYISRELSFSLLGSFVYYLVVLAGIAVFGVFVTMLIEQVLRPIVREASAGLPDGRPPAVRVPSLATKVLLLVPAIAFFTAGVVASLAAVEVSPEAYMAIVLLLTVVASLTISLALTFMLRRSLLDRVDELRNAMSRIAGGDFDVLVAPVAGDEIDDLGGSLNVMVQGLRDRSRLQDAFGSYVDAGLVDRVLREGKSLAGDRYDVSVLILDVREFTWLSARSTPEQTVGYLNELFELVIPLVLRQGGHPNKLLGDGVLAAFGAPEPLANHADAAVDAGFAILDAVAERFDGELEVGVGIDSGEVVAGTLGGGGKLDYTLIGNAVNTASRLEALTKQLRTRLLASQETYRRLSPDRRCRLASVGVQTIRGRSAPLEVYGPASGEPAHVDG